MCEQEFGSDNWKWTNPKLVPAHIGRSEHIGTFRRFLPMHAHKYKDPSVLGSFWSLKTL
jgi:hypothetical protein